MKWKALFLGFMGFAVSSAAHAYTPPPGTGIISIQAYEEAQQNSADTDTMLVYLKGVMDGFSFANGKNLLGHQALLFCPPTNYRVTGTQEVSILNQYLKDTNPDPDLPVAAAMLKALVITFPCN